MEKTDYSKYTVRELLMEYKQVVLAKQALQLDVVGATLSPVLTKELDRLNACEEAILAEADRLDDLPEG